MNNQNNDFFFARIFEQKRSIKTLTEESRPDADFYLFLGVSIFITTLGLLMDNPIIVIGAMLVAPILFPVLSLGMGVVTLSRVAMYRSLIILFKATIASIAISFLTTFLFKGAVVTEVMHLASTPTLYSLLVASAAGIIAAFAWVKKESELALPGVAITVTLVPPLSLIGVALSMMNYGLFVGSLLQFALNLLGIFFASVLAFSLFGFGKMQAYQEKEIKEEEKILQPEE